MYSFLYLIKKIPNKSRSRNLHFYIEITLKYGFQNKFYHFIDKAQIAFYLCFFFKKEATYYDNVLNICGKMW